jgi:hypothetical protein
VNQLKKTNNDRKVEQCISAKDLYNFNNSIFYNFIEWSTKFSLKCHDRIYLLKYKKVNTTNIFTYRGINITTDIKQWL